MNGYLHVKNEVKLVNSDRGSKGLKKKVKSVDHNEILNELSDLEDIRRKFVDWDNDNITDPWPHVLLGFVVSVLRR